MGCSFVPHKWHYNCPFCKSLNRTKHTKHVLPKQKRSFHLKVASRLTSYWFTDSANPQDSGLRKIRTIQPAPLISSCSQAVPYKISLVLKSSCWSLDWPWIVGVLSSALSYHALACWAFLMLVEWSFHEFLNSLQNVIVYLKFQTECCCYYIKCRCPNPFRP